jgi:hypothetical protein
MPKVCQVCAHPSRAEIDRQLASQVVNVAAVARHYGLHHKSVQRHRHEHLPDFLPIFDGRASAPGGDAVNAEAQRLYALALDALATAQAGVLVQVGKPDAKTGERHFERLVSPTSIARSIGEARKILGMISALAAAPRKAEAAGDLSTALEAGMSRALARFEQRMGQPALGGGPTDLDLVDEADLVDVVDQDGQVDRDGGVGPPGSAATPGAEAGSAPTPPSAAAGTLNPDESQKTRWNGPKSDQMAEFHDDSPEMAGYPAKDPTIDPDAAARAAELFLAGLDPKTRAHITDIMAQAAVNDQMNPERIERPWPGNPGASLEERRAAGWPDPVSLAEASPSTVRRQEVALAEERAELGLPVRSRRRGVPPADPARRDRGRPNEQ